MEYTQIKSFEDACTATGINPQALPDVSMLPTDVGEYLLSIYKLSVIAKAINGDWVADFGNHDQRKYYPWFYSEEGYKPGSGGGFSCDVHDYALTLTSVGARLSFETWEKAKYAGRTFIDLYEKALLIPQ